MSWGSAAAGMVWGDHAIEDWTSIGETGPVKVPGKGRPLGGLLGMQQAQPFLGSWDQ